MSSYGSAMAVVDRAQGQDESKRDGDRRVRHEVYRSRVVMALSMMSEGATRAPSPAGAGEGRNEGRDAPIPLPAILPLRHVRTCEREFRTRRIRVVRQRHQLGIVIGSFPAITR